MQQTLATLQQYESQIKAFSAQLNLLEEVTREHVRSQATLEGLKNAKPGQELIMPIGQGTFLFGTVTNTKKAIVSLGSQVSQELSLEEAMERVGNRINEAEKAMQEYAQSINTMQQQYAALNERVERAYMDAKAKGQP